MATKSRAIQHVEDVFGDGPEVAIAQSLVTHLANYSSTNHITLDLVRRITPAGETGQMDAAIFRTLQFLAGDGVRMLDTCFELLIDEKTVQEISAEEFRAAVAGHIDPFTGQEDSAIEDRLLIFFTPTTSDLDSGSGHS